MFLRFRALNRDFNVSEMSNSDEKGEAHTTISSESEGLTTMTNDNPPPAKSSNKPRRKNLTTAERLRIINDFKHGIPDKYYSVNPNPRRPGEFIVRKRKTPIEYEIEQNEVHTSISSKSEVHTDPSSTPSQLLTESTPPHNPLAGTEFFSMQSSLNANLQRELDALHEKFNKLDAKFRKERAARKDKTQVTKKPRNTSKSRPEGHTAMSLKSEAHKGINPKGENGGQKPEDSSALKSDSEYEYEYEYVDEAHSRGTESPTPPHIPLPCYFGLVRRPNFNIRDF